MAVKKNLVMGSGKNFSWWKFELFVRSFSQNVSNANLVLFADGLSDFTRFQLEEAGKEFNGGELKIIPFPEHLKSRHAANSRWNMFLDYVEKHGDEYGQIFISDTRDVIFQSNVFDCYKNNSNYLAYAVEDFAGRLGSYRGTRLKWLYNEMKAAFGEEEANKLSDKLILSPSAVIGTSKEIHIFLSKMCEYMPKNFDFYTLDLLTLSYIVYNNLVDVENIFESYCNDGDMLSADWFFNLNPVKIKDDLILRGDGGVPAVVHQYDRHDVLFDLAEKLYRKPIYRPDVEFSDCRSNVEKLLGLSQSYDLNETAFFSLLNSLRNDNLTDNFDELQRCWRNILKLPHSNSSIIKFSLALQNLIMSVSGDGLYILQAMQLHESLKYCKRNNLEVDPNFEEWIKRCVIKAVKWHLDHNNGPRYTGCVMVMVAFNLTDNCYFQLLMAEIYRSFGDRGMAALHYEQYLDYIGKDSFEKSELLPNYWQKIVEEMKFFSEAKPEIIKPVMTSKETTLVFDEHRQSFVVADKHDKV